MRQRLGSWLGVVIFGVAACCAASSRADGTEPVPNPCLTSTVVFDTSSLDTVVNHPDRVLADPEGFWQKDSAYVLVERWHRVLANVDIPWDQWLEKIRRFASMTDEERAADPSVALAAELIAGGDSWSTAALPVVCSFLPDTGAPLDSTIRVSGAMVPYAFMTQGQIVVDATSPRFQGDLDTVLNLITHEVFHIGYGWRRGARRELELEDPALYQMLDALHNEGMATYLGHSTLELYPNAAHDDYATLDDPAEVRRLIAALNDLFRRAPGMEADARRSASWELGVTERAYYVVGAHMARAIDTELGRSALVRTVVEGPRSFISTYNQIADDDLQIVVFPGPATEPPIHRLKLAAFDHDQESFSRALADVRRNPDGNGATAEAKLNSLGYFLLREGRTHDATQVFQLAVHLYPDSANAHDSLGEASMEAGDIPAAIASYQRSLALDPSNANAAAVLGRLRAEAADHPDP